MRIESWTGKSQKGAVAFLGLAFLCLLPFLSLASYAHSYLDDFMLSSLIRERGVWSQTVGIYLTWSGKFSAHLTMALHPLTWGGLEQVKPFVFGFIVFFASCLLFAGNALLQGHSIPLATRFAAGSIVLALVLVLLGSPPEAFYWLVSALMYMGGCACCFLLLGVIATLQVERKNGRRRFWWLVAGGLAFLVPGFTEVISCFVLALLVVSSPLFLRRKVTAGWAVLLLVAILGSAIAVLAPGNYVRHGSTISFPLLKSIVLASSGLAYTLMSWLGNGLIILVTLLVLPTIERLVRIPTLPLSRLTQRVWLWPLWILLGLLLTYLFCQIAIGSPPPSRIRNVLLAFFVVGWFMSVAGVLARHVRTSNRPLQMLPPYARFTITGLALLLLVADHNIKLQQDQIGVSTNSVIQAYQDWLSGDASQYDQEEEKRYRIIRSTQSDAVELPAFTVKPVTLFWLDISSDPALWGNQYYAIFFKKKKIWVKP